MLCWWLVGICCSSILTSGSLVCWFLLFSLVSFYTATPLSLCSNCIPEVYHFVASGLAQFIVQGKRQMPDVEVNLLDAVIPLSNLGWCQWIGAALFFWGWIHQHHCHQILVRCTPSIINCLFRYQLYYLYNSLCSLILHNQQIFRQYKNVLS